MESQIQNPGTNVNPAYGSLEPPRRPSIFRSAIAIISANRGPYIVVNMAYYGLVLCGMMVAAVYPPVQQKLLATLDGQLKTSALLAPVARAYASGNVPLAAMLTFIINSAVGAFACITLPAALIPFSGFAVGFYRAAMWGLTLSPTSPKMLFAMLPHSVTLLLEGQGYVLPIFGCYLWGKWVVSPAKSGFATRREGYVAGLRVNVQLYSLILTVLAVSAVYEAVEVIAMMRLAEQFR